MKLFLVKVQSVGFMNERETRWRTGARGGDGGGDGVSLATRVEELLLALDVLLDGDRLVLERAEL